MEIIQEVWIVTKRGCTEFYVQGPLGGGVSSLFLPLVLFTLAYTNAMLVSSHCFTCPTS